LKPYTSLRIYWKLFNDPTLEQSQLTTEENISRDGSKAFYLCKGDEVQMFVNKDIKLLMNNASETITQRIWGNRKNETIKNLDKVSVSSEVSMIPDILKMRQNVFWDYLISFVKAPRPTLTLTNIDFRFKTFNVEEKFPVQFWNTAKPDTKEKLLSSVESHWQLAQTYDQVEKNEIPNDLFLENVIKINHGKEKLSSLFQVRGNNTRKMKSKSNLVQAFEEGDDYETVTDQKNLPMSMRYRKYRENMNKVCVGPSKIHCQGLFALEHFSQGDIIIEYVGEVIDNQEADCREVYYEKSGMGDCYLFRLDKNRIIDASYKGNMARFLNHSCDASCNAKIESICGEKHILILANRFISKGEELTYFYNFAVESEKIECLCGAPNCLRRLN